MIKEKKLQIFRFILVGGTLALSHIIFVYFLTDVLGVWYLASTIFSYTLLTIINFLLQKVYVLKTSEPHVLSNNKQSLYFSLLTVGNLVFNAVGMFVLVGGLGVHYLAAQAFVIFVLATITFLVNKKIIFR